MQITEIKVDDYQVYLAGNQVKIAVPNGGTWEVFSSEIPAATNEVLMVFCNIQKWAKSQAVKPDIIQIAKELERYLEEVNNPKELIVYGYRIFLYYDKVINISKKDRKDTYSPWNKINSRFNYHDDLLEWLKTADLGENPTIKEVAAKVTAYFEEPRTVKGYRLSVLKDQKESVNIIDKYGHVFVIGSGNRSWATDKLITFLSDKFYSKTTTIPEVAKEIEKYKEPLEWQAADLVRYSSGRWRIFLGVNKWILSNEKKNHLSYHETLEAAQEAAN